MVPLVPPRAGITAAGGAVVWLQASLARYNPHLDEAQGICRTVVELRVHHSCSSTHVLNRTSSEAFDRAHRVPVAQLPLDDISDNLHVAVRVGAKTSRRLHQVIVHDPEAAKVRLSRHVLRKVEVKPRLEPVATCPRRVRRLISPISKPARVRLRHEQTFAWDNLGRHTSSQCALQCSPRYFSFLTHTHKKKNTHTHTHTQL
mmetsp:Transcript_9374/g.28263  ORF Transcript_9374/g.28263 Transcript_9374/m.28263 type:complete len:202 (+) Transcript_9374:492-1097(+)